MLRDQKLCGLGGEARRILVSQSHLKKVEMSLVVGEVT